MTCLVGPARSQWFAPAMVVGGNMRKHASNTRVLIVELSGPVRRALKRLWRDEPLRPFCNKHQYVRMPFGPRGTCKDALPSCT